MSDTDGEFVPRKIFCLIKETDVPETDARADKMLERLGSYRCGCGWPMVPCIEMHPDLRNPPAIVTNTTLTLATIMPGWQRPWNRSPRRLVSSQDRGGE